MEIKDVITRIITDSSSFNYFFRNLNSEKYWYELKDEKFFEPARFPDKNDENGNVNTLYAPLVYLEKLSDKVKKNEIDSETYSKELVGIIRQTSDYFKEKKGEINLRTCWFFLLFMKNLPTKFITIDLINEQIAFWISNEEGLNYLERELYELLFRNLFSSDNPDDWKKAEILFKLIIKVTQKSKDFTERYLRHEFFDFSNSKEFYKNIETKISKSFIDFLIVQIEDYVTKKYPYNISFKLGDKKWNFIITYRGESHFGFEDKENNVSGHFKFNPTQHEEKLLEEVIKNVKEIDIKSISEISNNYNLLSKQYLSFSYEFSIFNEEREEFGSDVIPLLILTKKIIKQWSKVNGNNVKDLINDFLTEKHEVFIRLVLYLIDGNWENLNSYFFEYFLGKPKLTFDSSFIDLDTKEFLKRNIGRFSSNQKELLLNTINSGPFEYADDYSINEKKKWRLKWLYCVKEDSYLGTHFNILNSELNVPLTEFENEARVTYYHDSSPKTLDELESMEITEIHQLFYSFSPDSFKDHTSIREFANTVGKLLNRNPQKFYDLIEFKEIPYAYAERIINAFEENWKKEDTRTNVDIEKSITFIERYLVNIVRVNKKLILESDSRFDAPYLA